MKIIDYNIEMHQKQTAILLQLAKDLEEKGTSKKTAIATLHGAGIVTKKGTISKNYPNLKRVLSTNK